MSWILLVEGQDDLHVIRNFLFERGIDVTRHQLHDCRGDTQLLDVLDATITAAAHDVVGAVIDADADVAARWQSIRHRLGRRGYDLPIHPDPQGTIVRGDRTVGIWLMPDNTAPGAVEQFVRNLIPADDALWPLAHETVASIPRPLRRFSDSATIKAELHTWLAWQEEPGTRMGAAITKRYLQRGSVTADAFATWVQRLAASAQE